MVVSVAISGRWSYSALKPSPGKQGWRQSHMDPVPAQADATEPTTVPHAACRSAWARLIAKVYEVDPPGR